MDIFLTKLMSLKKDTRDCSLSPCTQNEEVMGGPNEKIAVYKSEREASLETNPDSILILAF